MQLDPTLSPVETITQTGQDRDTSATSSTRGDYPKPDSTRMSSDIKSRPPAESSTAVSTGPNTKPEEPKIVKRFIIMGPTGAGKSTLINSITGSTFDVSDGLVSCTQGVAFSPCLRFKSSNVWIQLIDTPGFNDSVRSEIDVLEEIANGLKQLHVRKKSLHGIIYLHKISDYRMSGSARQHFQTFLNICGKPAMPHVLIVTNRWDAVTPDVGEAREMELRNNSMLFKPALENGARIYRNNDPPESLRNIIQVLIELGPVELAIQADLAQGKPLLETKAGAEINREMARKYDEHRAEILKLNQEYKTAQEKLDSEAQEEIAHEREYRRKRMEELRSVANRMREQARQQAAVAGPRRPKQHDETTASSEFVSDTYEPTAANSGTHKLGVVVGDLARKGWEELYGLFNSKSR